MVWSRTREEQLQVSERGPPTVKRTSQICGTSQVSATMRPKDDAKEARSDASEQIAVEVHRSRSARGGHVAGLRGSCVMEDHSSMHLWSSLRQSCTWWEVGGAVAGKVRCRRHSRYLVFKCCRTSSERSNTHVLSKIVWGIVDANPCDEAADALLLTRMDADLVVDAGVA